MDRDNFAGAASGIASGSTDYLVQFIRGIALGKAATSTTELDEAVCELIHEIASACEDQKPILRKIASTTAYSVYDQLSGQEEE
jgi:hypothetical protein